MRHDLTKTQLKHTFKLADCVELFIQCCECEKNIGGYGTDEASLAEEAAVNGWIVDKNGYPKCKDCKR